MLTSPVGPAEKGLVASFRRFHWLEGFIVAWTLLVAVGFNLTYLYPGVAGDVLDGNDSVLHLLLARAAVEAITQGQDFTDPWQGTMSMGFPLFHYYQHLPHIGLALVHVLTLQAFPLADLLHWTTYLLLSLFPLSIYWSLRRFGFDRISSAMGGLVAPLAATNALYGFSFASYVFAGWGLYSQLWGMVLLPPALAVSYHVLRDGRGYFWATLLLAATLMSHLMYGYMVFLTLGALTFIQPAHLLNPKTFLEAMWRQWRRLIILFLLVVAVTSYFLVPLFLDIPYFNQSIWLDPRKYDSYGHSEVLSGLINGHLFDFNRFPSLTYLIFVGFVISLFRWREERYLIPVSIFLVWLLLYFGRSSWGSLIDLLPMSRYLHMHRFIAGVHLGGIFLIAVALAAPWRWAVLRPSFWRLWCVSGALVLTLLVLLPVYSERRSYLELNALRLSESQQWFSVEEQDLNDLLEKLGQLPPGRVYAGQQMPGGRRHWSDTYNVGGIHVYDMLHAAGLDMMGNHYHAYSLNSDVLINFDERRWDHYNLYNARYVVAPEGPKFPAFVQPLRQFGRHRLYQIETTGYFDLVNSNLSFAGEGADVYTAASSWLASSLPIVKQHPRVSVSGTFRGNERPLPLSAAGDVFPAVEAFAGPFRGAVVSEEAGSNFFAADVNVERESMLLLKANYHPNWRATVDGVKTETVMLMPSFVGVPLTPGDHKVRMEYRPRRLRLILLCLGLLNLSLIALAEMRGEAFYRWFNLRVMGPLSNSVKRRYR
ncbi:MAG TPA: hypothetical protein EYM38_03615 [Dehalococcoidia bacterium]|nr:hypothetical protein [Dehalococcoidia bacterium]